MADHGPLPVALALTRSWRANRIRSASAFAAIAIGVALLTLVSSLSLAIVSSLSRATGFEAIDSEIVVSARSTSGLSTETVGEIAAVDGVDAALPAVIVSTRVGDGAAGNLTLLGLTAEAATLVPDLAPSEAVAPAPGTNGLVVTSQWADDQGVAVGDVVSLLGVVTGVRWTILATVEFDAVGTSAVAAADLDQVRTAFGRGPGVDAVFVQSRPDVDRGALEDSLREVVAGRASVGDAANAVATVVSSFGIVRVVLFLVAGVGVMVGISVVYVCWRLQLLSDRRTLAMIRLAGARTRQLAAGAAFVFLLVTGLALAVGVPLGLLGARLLDGFSSQLVGMSGFAAARTSPAVLLPALAGAAGGLGMGTVAWLLALRSVVRVPAIEALSDVRVEPRQESSPVAWCVLGAAVTTLAWALSVVLSVQLQPATLALFLTAAVLLARAVPPVVGRGLRAVDDVAVRLSARHYEVAGRQTAATTTILVVALTFAIGLAGLTAGFELGIRESVQAWTGGDAFVEAGEPGQSVRDQRLPPELAAELATIPGVASLSGFALNQIEFDGRLVPVYSWAPDATDGFVDLVIDEGLGGNELWATIGAGDVAVTENFASQHGLDVGDVLSLPTPDGVIEPRIRATVVDFLSDTGIIYTSIDTAERLAGNRRLSAITVAMEEGVDQASVREALEAAVAHLPGSVVWTGAKLQGHLEALSSQLLLTMKLLSWASELLAVLVACTTVAATVASRKREYGLLGLSGATTGLVRRQLRVEFVGLGLLSWVLAGCLGLLTIGPLRAISRAAIGLDPPFVLPVFDVVAALFVALAASLVAAWAPTRSMLSESIVDRVGVGE